MHRDHGRGSVTMRLYRLKVDGQIVPIKQSTPRLANGLTPVISRARVGYAGEEFKSLPDDLVAKIEGGELGDTWEVVDVSDDEDDDEDSSTEASSATEPPDLSDIDFDRMSPRELVELAAAHGIDVQGSGREGRILKDDVITALEAKREEG